MAVAEHLTELATGQGSLETAKQVFDLTNARLFLQFKPVQVKKRLLNKISGGVVTFCDAEPPISIYEGPTGRRRIKSEKNPALDGTALSRPETLVSGQEDRSLGNVSRGDKTAIELFRVGVPTLFQQLPNALQGLTTSPA
ncbi:MAG: hypothetical protein O3C40_18425 [Planctomycetota bacterium]|nr:hypothetical protein [Planctomycetota bacterium]